MLNQISSITVQEFRQDTNGTRIAESLDSNLIAASRLKPIHLAVTMARLENPPEAIGRVRERSFIAVMNRDRRNVQRESRRHTETGFL